MRQICKNCSFFCVVLLIVSFLLTGCGSEPSQPVQTIPSDTGIAETSGPAESVQAADPPQEMEDAAYASLVSLRQGLIETPQCFAVAYFGYVLPDDGEPADPYGVMAGVAPQLCEDLPFLLQIPRENSIGTEGHLFCILPKDEQATVSVNWSAWDEAAQTYADAAVLYRSEKGDPFLLMTTNTGWCMETEVILVDSQGKVTVWYPFIDENGRIASLCDENGESLYLDFSPYEQLNDENLTGGVPAEMAGAWELTWVEVEGDRIEAAPGVRTLEITTDGAAFWLSYWDKDFPEDNFTDRELAVSPGELYPDCGNNQWIAEAAAESHEIIHYAVSLLDDGTLLMQHSWEMDGMPMVSYAWYRRMS